MKAFDCKCEAFIIITRLFEDIFNESEAFLTCVRVFQRIQSFLKLLPDKWRFFSLLWDILKGVAAFQIYVKKSGGFCKDYEAFKRYFQRSVGL
jgi:hypothetical protein